jgi:hypothetical protein
MWWCTTEEAHGGILARLRNFTLSAAAESAHRPSPQTGRLSAVSQIVGKAQSDQVQCIGIVGGSMGVTSLQRWGVTGYQSIRSTGSYCSGRSSAWAWNALPSGLFSADSGSGRWRIQVPCRAKYSFLPVLAGMGLDILNERHFLALHETGKYITQRASKPPRK